jgi:hypothetical protein
MQHPGPILKLGWFWESLSWKDPGNSHFGKNDEIQPKNGPTGMTLQRYPAPLFTVLP